MARKLMDKVQEVMSVYNNAVANAITYNEREVEIMRREKVRRYLPYREARECLRKQKEFLADIKSRGIEALKGETKPKGGE